LWRRRPLIPKNFRKLWERLRESAELKPAGRPSKNGADDKPQIEKWPHDALRHTAATMHYAFYQNASLLKAQFGHVEHEDTLFSNYRAVRLADGRPASKAVAAKFYAVVPTAKMLRLLRE
jgi:hypothetical protein